MKKILLSTFILFLQYSFANEPTLALLRNINTNTQQQLSIGEYHFICNAYGVLGTTQILERENLNESCKEELLLFYKKNPLSSYYAQRNLHLQQLYHIEFKEQQCLMYVQGQRTLSELLLEEGLVVLKPHFKDKEFFAPFTRAYESAVFQRKGVHKDGVLRKCFAEFYK